MLIRMALGQERKAWTALNDLVAETVDCETPLRPKFLSVYYVTANTY
jgi:hypothetical protein